MEFNMTSQPLTPTPATEQESNDNNDNIPKQFIPDFRTFGRHQQGFSTEIGSSDADKIKRVILNAASSGTPPPPQHFKQQQLQQQASLSRSSTITSSLSGRQRTISKRQPKQQPIINTIAGYRVSHALPDDSRIGWTSFSDRTNPGGSLNLLALEKKPHEKADDIEWNVKETFVDDFIVVFIVGFGFHLIGSLGSYLPGGGIGSFIFGLFCVATYYKINHKRFCMRTSDDIKKELAALALQNSDFEDVEWLNNLITKFWLIFEPVISAYVVENIDTYLIDYLPGFLDSVRLTTFTLGSKPFRIESVKTLPDMEPDTVCMDWDVSFVPNDTSGMTKEQLDKKINPKVVLNIRLGKGFVGTALSVLVEDMSFKGRMRIKLQMMSKMPHVRIVEACFMEKPVFDYVLKPMGGETFGFDVNNIPGLQSFVRDQAHAILGPMFYYPNVFSYNVEKFFSGELDISQANGVLAVTVHSCSIIGGTDGTVNPFIRFFLDKAQELEKTSVLENTRTPHWNETKFLLMNNLESMLTMELRTTNSTKKAGKRLARAHFDLKDMRDEEDMELDNLTLPMFRHGRLITNLNVDMRYFPVSKPIQNADGTYIEAEPSNSGVLRIVMHEAKHLGSKKCNPYASIKINGADRFETPTFKRTSNPKFERPFELLVLDMSKVFIRVSLIDRIDFAEDESLGSWDAYLTDIMQQQEEREYWWNLRKRGQEVNARIRFSVQWKPVVMTGLATMGGVGIYSSPVGVIRFSIWSAKNLAKRSKHDMYVRIKSGKQVRARTEIINSTDWPEWGEFHYIPVHSLHEDLVLEVMAWNSGSSAPGGGSSKDKSMGSTVFPIKELVQQCKDDTTDTVYYTAKMTKIDKDTPLMAGEVKKGSLIYSAEFYPTMALPKTEDDQDAIEKEGLDKTLPTQLQQDQSVTMATTWPPRTDLHNLPIRYTPDDLIDLSSYGSGVLTVKIHEIKAPQVLECYCQVMVDSLTPQHKTNTIKGRLLTINEMTDAFIKDAGFSRVAIALKPAKSSEKDYDAGDQHTLGYWYESSERIIRHIQQNARAKGCHLYNMLKHAEDDEGEWYNIIQPAGASNGNGGNSAAGAQIRLSFGYTPLLNYTINPDESLENQGVLTVTLLRARDLKAADKSGTSDPYVKFTVNGDVVHKSSYIKKTCNPVWEDEKFQVPIISRVTASFRIEVFDHNSIHDDVPLGSGGITLRGDMVESFLAHEVEIPLDGQAGDTGSVRVRLKWEPQLLMHRKASTFMGISRKTTTGSGSSATTTRIGTTAFNWGSQPPPSKRNNNNKVVSASNSSGSIVSENRKSMAPSTDMSSSTAAATAATAATGDELLNKGTVHIELIEARGLPGDENRVNPVATITLTTGSSGKPQGIKTKKMKKTLNPFWNEKFSRVLNHEKEDVQLDIRLTDAHTFGSSNDIGIWSSSLWDLVRPPVVTTLDKWLPLEPEGSGEVHVKITFEM